jgi:hypothetical protein
VRLFCDSSHDYPGFLPVKPPKYRLLMFFTGDMEMISRSGTFDGRMRIVYYRKQNTKMA